ncbi:MAG: alpha/beta fold hydrolase [bacterium]|nr:MAG: alpha/beta fold hydrolase [bacterium]
MEEKAFFFRTHDRPLYGMLFSPGGNGMPPVRNGPVRGVVVCDSLFEEKFWCERVVANMGRYLAERGVPVLSFDYFGCGNSTGSSEDVDVHGLERDVDAACDLLRGTGVDRITLLGIRWGAALACTTAVRRGDIDSLVLVQPVQSWRRELMKALRANVAGQYAIFKKAAMTRERIIEALESNCDCTYAGYRMNNNDGYLVSNGFYDQMQACELPLRLPSSVAAVTIISIPVRKTAVPPDDSDLVEAIRSNNIPCEGCTVTEDNAFWVNNQIFTSLAPNLYRSVHGFLESLPAGERRIRSGGGGTAGNGVEGIPGDGGKGPAGEEGDAAGNGRVTDTRPVGSGTDSFRANGIVERIVSFRSTTGDRLNGVLYLPDAEQRENTAFIFTHGGLIGMNGAFRFNTRAARRFAGAGYPSLCCDTQGMGRSSGAIGNIDQRVLFRKIQDGLFAGDVAAAADFLREQIGVTRVVLFGVCGGAITNIITHARFESINGSVLLSIPVMLSGLSHEQVRMSEGFARFYLGMYLRKVFNPVAWWRFLTLQSDYKMIFKSLEISGSGVCGRLLGGKRKAARPGSRKGKPTGTRVTAAVNGRRCACDGTAAASAGSRGLDGAATRALDKTSAVTGSSIEFNFEYLDSYRSIVERGDKVLFIFGENDNFKWEFNSEFAERYPEDLEMAKGLIRFEEVQHANHMYTLREWQDEIIGRVLAWIERTDLSRA